MRRAWMIVAVVILPLLVVTSGCATRQLYSVPPRIDLAQHEMIGVVLFDCPSEGELGSLATRRFQESARRDQGLVRMVALGSRGGALGSVGGTEWDVEALKAIGRERGVRTILTGRLEVSDVKPDIRLGPALRSGGISAKVDASLAVELIETSTGASIWSRSARATKMVGHIGILPGGEFVFDADDPETAYGPLVDHLVEEVARDFHVTLERR